MAEAFDIAFNRVRLTVGDAFYEAVSDRMDILRDNVGEQVKELFEDISLSFGEDTIPAEIAVYTGWSDLTNKWIKRKRARTNRFYLGRSKGLKRALANKGGKFVYGEPLVTLARGLAAGFSRSSGRLRVAKGFAGAGRFAASISALRATIEIVPFPLVGDDPTSIFKGKLGVKVGAGEYGADNRPSRPFLGPFIRYYTEVKIPGIIERTVRL